MPATRNTATQRSQIGAEVTPGTMVPATKRFPNLTLLPSIIAATTPFRGQGFKYNSSQVVGKEHTGLTYTGAASYGELPYLLASVLGLGTPSVVGTGTLWTFAHSMGNADTPQTYTVEHGDGTYGSRNGYTVFDSITMNLTRDAFTVNGTGLGQLTTSPFTMTSANEVQTLTITGTPTGGTFQLLFGGATTTPIPWNAAAAAVQTALQALPTGGPNITCSGTTLPSPITINFIGGLAGMDVPLITAIDAGLTGGATPHAIITATTQGSPKVIENVPIIPQTCTLSVDTTLAAIGTTVLPHGYSMALSLAGRWGMDWPINGALPSFGSTTELVPKAAIKLEIQADATSDLFLAQLRGAGVKYLQLKCVGPLISAGVYYGLTVNIPFMVDKPNPLKDLAGVYCIDWDLAPVADGTAGYAINAYVINNTATL